MHSRSKGEPVIKDLNNLVTPERFAREQRREGMTGRGQTPKKAVEVPSVKEYNKLVEAYGKLQSDLKDKSTHLVEAISGQKIADERLSEAREELDRLQTENRRLNETLAEKNPSEQGSATDDESEVLSLKERIAKLETELQNRPEKRSVTDEQHIRQLKELLAKAETERDKAAAILKRVDEETNEQYAKFKTDIAESLQEERAKIQAALQDSQQAEAAALDRAKQLEQELADAVAANEALQRELAEDSESESDTDDTTDRTKQMAKSGETSETSGLNGDLQPPINLAGVDPDSQKGILFKRFNGQYDMVQASVRKLRSRIDNGNAKDDVQFWDEVLTKQYGTLNLYDQQLMSLMTGNEADQVHRALLDTETCIIAVRSQLSSYVAGLNRAQAAQRIADGSRPPSSKMAKFDGDCTKWTGWYKAYKALCDRDDMKEVQRFNFILEHVTGEAQKSIENYTYSEGILRVVIQTLVDRFGDSDRIIEAHRKALETLPKCKGKLAELRLLKATVDANIDGLNQLRVPKDKYEEMVVKAMGKNLPDIILNEWIGRLKVRKPSLQQMRTCLDDEIVKIEGVCWLNGTESKLADAAHVFYTDIDQKGGASNKGKQQKGKGGASGGKPSGDGTADKGKKAKAKCLFCEKTHKPYRCKEGSLENRKKVVSDKKLCVRCLRAGHAVADCTSTFDCAHCKQGTHSSTLCDKKYGPKPATPAATEDGCNLVIDEQRHVSFDIPTDSTIEQVLVAEATKATILPTFTVLVTGRDGKRYRALGLMDTGATRTFIRQGFVDQLGWEPTHEEELTVRTFGSESGTPTNYKAYTLRMRGTHESLTDTVKIRVLGQEKLSNLTTFFDSDFAKKLAGKKFPMADDRIYGKDCFDEIDIILGSDQYYNIILRDMIKISKPGLIATKCRFGWLVHGSIGASTRGDDSVNTISADPVDDMHDIQQLEFDHKQFWILEHLGVMDAEETDPTFQALYEASITRSEEGRYQAPLPWKEIWDKLKDNYSVASKRLEALMRRFGSNPTGLATYHEQFQTYVQEGFIEPASPDYKGVRVYLPHRDIVRVDAASTKCRPVFDGSSHHKGTPSLNEALEVGPNLNPELMEVLLRFRMYPSAWTADITKAFLQIELKAEDSQVIRFLWYTDPSDPTTLTEYAWKRLPFGLTSSPFILRAVLFKHLKSYEEQYPETVRQLRKQLYVDDWLGGADSTEEAVKRVTEAISILKDAKMELAKWITNDKELERRLEGVVAFQHGCAAIGQTMANSDLTKALGVFWNPESDQFVFRPHNLVTQAEEMGPKPTKRQVFSLALRLFDPLGLLSPVVLVAKLIMQKLWLCQMKWDEIVPAHLTFEWKTFLSGLDLLDEIKINRWVGCTERTAVGLHVFCDASEDAYSAVIYVRPPNDPSKTILLCSKTRVAPPPRKSVSIPRLELLSNLLGSRLAAYAKKAFHGHQCQLTAWTDSTVALYWIVGEAGRWKTFVHNRVVKIREVFKPEDIRHCPGTENPADVASRGTTTMNLLRMKEWWTGPTWLAKPNVAWPRRRPVDETKMSEVEVEAKQEISVLTVEALKVVKWFEQYSSFLTLQKIMAFTRRWIDYRRNRLITPDQPTRMIEDPRLQNPVEVPCLSGIELSAAFMQCVRVAQVDIWPTEFFALLSGKKVHKRSGIAPLRPQWDPVNRVIRGCGRTERELNKPGIPILLPSRHHITRLIIAKEHLDLKHAGRHQTMLSLRQKFWIPAAFQRVKDVIGICVACARNNSRHFDAPAAQLPEDRVTQLRPFEVCGVDYAGPFEVFPEPRKDVKHRPEITTAHACIFTCASTRAVYIEPVPNASGLSFLYALRKLVASRGMPRKIYSDNGKQFSYAARILTKIQKQKHVNEYLAHNKIEWKFIPSKAPWWGGFWERMVQSMKRHLKATLGKETLDYEQFDVILKEISYVMNCRPITRADHDSGFALTPLMLMTGELGHCREFEPRDDRTFESYGTEATPTKLLARDERRKLKLKEWWTVWRDEYLAEIRRFDCKGSNKIKLPMLGHVVIIHDPDRPRTQWITGRITKIIPSEDGMIRQVELMNSKHEKLTRPIQTLYPLEANAGTIDYDAKNPGQLLQKRQRKPPKVPEFLKRVRRPVLPMPEYSDEDSDSN